MRLWSIHPGYLDGKGLVALWREALLARAVLLGRTKGYRHHPQLARFRSAPRPTAAINAYLRAIARESTARGYHFDARKAGRASRVAAIAVSNGQIEYEWRHLRGKLRLRDRARWRATRAVKAPMLHPSFRSVPGPVEVWERRPLPAKRRAG